MFVQSASQELRNPPSVAWRALLVETVVFVAIAMLMVAFI
jgi:hypothetical protein